MTHDKIRKDLNLHPMDDDILAVVKDGSLLYIGCNIEKAHHIAEGYNALIYAHSERDLAYMIQENWKSFSVK